MKLTSMVMEYPSPNHRSLGHLVALFHQCPVCGANTVIPPRMGNWSTMRIMCCGSSPRLDRIPANWEGAYF